MRLLNYFCMGLQGERQTGKERQTYKERERQTDKERERQTGKERERQTDKERETDRQTKRETDRRRDKDKQRNFFNIIPKSLNKTSNTLSPQDFQPMFIYVKDVFDFLVLLREREKLKTLTYSVITISSTHIQFFIKIYWGLCLILAHQDLWNGQ